MSHAILFPLLAFAIALTVLWGLVGSRASQIAMDRPNERSLHTVPMPRTGGVGLHAGVILLCPLVVAGMPGIVWIACLGLLIVSFMDDVRGLPVIARLAAHLIAAGAYSALEVHPGYGLMAAAVATLGIAWIINLYNFMDGSDGLAGGMALIGFGFYGVAAWLAGSTGFALINLCIAAAAAAFLVFNFHPARIFMGDVGAVPLGFLAGTAGIHGWLQQIWTWWFPLLVFSPFIVDASVTLARRALRGARIWEAHREHCYQKLVRMGWGHRRTALTEYALMTLCGIAALAGRDWTVTAQVVLLITAVVLYAAIISFVEIAWCEFLARSGNEG